MVFLDRPVVVLTDHTGNDAEGYALTLPSQQLLTLARTLTHGPVIAVALNNAPDMTALAAYGAQKVLIPDLGTYSPRVSAIVADAVLACMSHISPAAVLMVANYRGKEVCARLAARTGNAAAVDISTVTVTDEGNFCASRTALAGSWVTNMSITESTPLFAVRPMSVDEEPISVPTAPQIEHVSVQYSPEATAVCVHSSQHQPATGRASLTQARTVVVAGRGIEGDFTLVDSLADILGGAVGATRVVTDEGWAPRSLQIGQTGVSISPNLYVGLGVSGAIHHTVGMQSSENIVAICDDPDAPIFEIADFGVVGDLNEVIPQAIDTIKKVRNAQ
ncbi:electron transfer flavoprotein subunit alpha/FixB family protein [Schaalia sp. lx-100]|uniref:electron transfer flavoprotein subunit alpha/FixB family protein n=1 Tax=Schaalia sp. lx-100 TaxID=2899081 RepID=UPI001E501F11|nr:electron transfer flavoprotein subunit alpha/FixB family protein [Schaalia sp. lx-100]MCD4557958.1 electron transfer flavoprotein subunit alpha/FixB family protein [Schaalia sp. lx-100]